MRATRKGFFFLAKMTESARIHYLENEISYELVRPSL